ncbi:MAG: ABC transporter permease subunit [Planctomycetales bacterium]|nr:ABC transporter permease subunit [Planctomycetales bacterium]
MLFLLLCTAWLVLAGTQLVRNLGDLALFGQMVFGVLAPLQLVLAVFFSALFAASAVSQEKDRRTLVLLLMTRLTNVELVLGKLLASMLNVLMLLAAAVPIFTFILLFGGVSVGQVVRTFAVTVLTALAAGSLGSLLALWREKTFQALALTALVIVAWTAACEAIAAGAFGNQWGGVTAASWATILSPWRAVLAAGQPFPRVDVGLAAIGGPVGGNLLVAAAATVLLNAWAIWRVRVWNPSAAVRRGAEEGTVRESIWGAEHDVARAAAEQPSSEGAAAPAMESAPNTGSATAAALSASKQHPPSRRVWNNPIIWREICTWAYGRKILAIRFSYWLLFAAACVALYVETNSDVGLTRLGVSSVMIPLYVLSLVLVNAMAVTSLTTERDGRAIDLLLVTDVTPKEFVFGKLGGVFFNAKEMVLLPMLLTGYLWYADVMDGEGAVYVLGGLLVMNVFVAMLGLHTGMAYTSSRQAIATSLGTVFFLFLGIATCMRIMVAFSGSFQVQFMPFLAMNLGGSVGLYVALGLRNPSTAIGLAALLCPFATFYAITSFLLEYTLAVFIVTVLMYGFTTAAMMIPAIYEFDVATGRTTQGEE